MQFGPVRRLGHWRELLFVALQNPRWEVVKYFHAINEKPLVAALHESPEEAWTTVNRAVVAWPKAELKTVVRFVKNIRWALGFAVFCQPAHAFCDTADLPGNSALICRKIRWGVGMASDG